MRREKNNLPINAQNFEDELRKKDEYVLRAEFYVIDKNFKCVLRKEMTRYTPQEPGEYIKEPEIDLLRDIKDVLIFNKVNLDQPLSLCVEIHTYSKKEKREIGYHIPLKRNILFSKLVN
jgi:hypothetical protein